MIEIWEMIHRLLNADILLITQLSACSPLHSLGHESHCIVSHSDVLYLFWSISVVLDSEHCLVLSIAVTH